VVSKTHLGSLEEKAAESMGSVSGALFFDFLGSKRKLVAKGRITKYKKLFCLERRKGRGSRRKL